MESVTSKDGTALAFDRLGDGPPLIMVGGALNDRQMLAPLAQLLAPHVTVFNYDRRGRGDSGDTLPYSVDREIDDLNTMIGEAGGAAMLFANCTGGMLAVEAVARGLAITKLALYEPPYIVGDNPLRLNDAFRAQLEEYLRAGKPSKAVAHFMIKTVGMPRQATVGMRMHPMWPAIKRLAPSLRYDVAVAGDNWLPPRERLAGATMPALVMYGTRSPDWQIESVKELGGLLPDASCRSLDGQMHRVDPKVVAPLLREFLTA
jgi:pimeloyl-ACP methyl ester carboxylesterase